jgi:hypothetical protein
VKDPDHLAVTDLDGNGTLDVIVGLRSLYPSSIETFFNDGTGALTVGAIYNAGALLSNGYYTASSIVAGDFESTGRNDVLVTDGRGLFLYANPGNGVFGSPRAIDIGGGPGWLTAADFNADGRLDVATTTLVVPTDGGTVLDWAAILLGDGHGGFSRPMTYPDNASSGVASADFNGDGYPDLLTGNSSWVSVLLSQCLPTR